jgi:hypothetical protein
MNGNCLAENKALKFRLVTCLLCVSNIAVKSVFKFEFCVMTTVKIYTCILRIHSIVVQ